MEFLPTFLQSIWRWYVEIIKPEAQPLMQFSVLIYVTVAQRRFVPFLNFKPKQSI